MYNHDQRCCAGHTWWQLLGDLVGCGSCPLFALDAVDVLHHGHGHVEGFLILAMTLTLLPLLQEQRLQLLLKHVVCSRHVQFIKAHLEKNKTKSVK